MALKKKIIEMKIDTNAIIKKYKVKRKNYETLESEVHYLLSKLLDEQKIKIHSIPHRIKEVNSLINKIRKNNILRPFEQVHDMVGFRVVCLFLADLETIGNAIKTKFNAFEEDDKINKEEFNVFGYMSLHIKAKLKNSSIQGISDIPFEIQVRTIAQDAWASISHHIDYKTNSVPDKFKRDFHALSGLFYVADTHFSFIKRGWN